MDTMAWERYGNDKAAQMCTSMFSRQELRTIKLHRCVPQCFLGRSCAKVHIEFRDSAQAVRKSMNTLKRPSHINHYNMPGSLAHGNHFLLLSTPPPPQMHTGCGFSYRCIHHMRFNS